VRKEPAHLKSVLSDAQRQKLIGVEEIRGIGGRAESNYLRPAGFFPCPHRDRRGRTAGALHHTFRMLAGGASGDAGVSGVLCLPPALEQD
jgi:hypothetical protein